MPGTLFTAEDFAAGSPRPAPTHYKLSSQSFGGWTYDSVGRSTPRGASTPNMPTQAPTLNGPPSAFYLPYGIYKTPGTNGRTLPPPQEPTFSQVRYGQTSRWTPARLYTDTK